MKTEAEGIGIVGAGLIGASWAAFYASKGFAVRLYDADAAAMLAGQETALGYLASLRDYGMLDPEIHDRDLDRIVVADGLSDAVRGARLVQESVTERNDVKRDVLRQIDRVSDPQTVVASSSSGLLISELQTVMDHPERSLIAHPFNPPHLIPLLELVPGRRTDPKTLSETKAFFESLGKVPVVLRKEVPGHVANRLQAAVWREAIHLVLEDVVSVADVDKALAAGPGIRWALLGPHMIFHLAGGPGGIKHFIDHIGDGWDEIWSDLASWTSLPTDTADALVSGVQEEAGNRTLHEIAEWRDAKIVQLLRAIEDGTSDNNQ